MKNRDPTRARSLANCVTFPTRRMKPKSIALLVAGFLSGVAALPAQVIPNPSFENSTGLGTGGGFISVNAGSTAITSWTVGGAGIDYINSTYAVSAGYNGSYLIDLVRTNGDFGSISTTITGLTPGAAYRLSFDMNQVVVETATTIRVDVDSAFQTYLNATNDTWQSQHIDFTAGASTATLTFSGPASGAADVGVYVDNATISAIPEPSMLALATGCFAALAVAVRKTRRA